MIRTNKIQTNDGSGYEILASKYLSIAEQLDAIWWSIDKGEDLKQSEF